MPAGATVILHGDIEGPVVEGDPYYTNTLKITERMTLTCAEEATLSGIVELAASGIVLDAVDYAYTGKNTSYGNILVRGSDIVIRNSTLFADYDLMHSVAPNSDRDRSNEFGFISFTGAGAQLLNNAIRTNAMGIFSSGANAVVRGNTVKNLDGYAGEDRQVWFNSASMDNVLIEGNTIYNRHMVLGGSGAVTNNKFLNLGENGSAGHAFYFWDEFSGTISGNDYSGRVDPDYPLATGREGVTIPSVN